MTDKQCPSWEGCEAPLCPMDKSFGLALWFPSEPICVAHAFRGTLWRRNQVKIAKRCRKRDTAFTVRMLEAVRAVMPGIEGLDPERLEDSDSVASWLGRRGQRPFAHEKGHEPAMGKALVGVGDTLEGDLNNVTAAFKGNCTKNTPPSDLLENKILNIIYVPPYPPREGLRRFLLSGG